MSGRVLGRAMSRLLPEMPRTWLPKAIWIQFKRLVSNVRALWNAHRGVAPELALRLLLGLAMPVALIVPFFSSSTTGEGWLTRWRRVSPSVFRISQPPGCKGDPHP